jgi:hypothetical protein
MNSSAQGKLELSLDFSVAQGIDFILKQEYGKADSLFCDVINHAGLYDRF